MKIEKSCLHHCSEKAYRLIQPFLRDYQVPLLRQTSRKRLCSIPKSPKTRSARMPHSVHSPSQTSTPPEQNRCISQQYWNVNVPEVEWTVECPDFLLGISEKNKKQLSTKDADYRLKTWDEVRELCSESPNFSHPITSSQRILPCQKS